LRHKNVRKNYIRSKCFEPLNCLPSIVDAYHADALVGESKVDNFLNRD
jgi:hypothetical protein